MAYELEFPAKIAVVHPIFHISFLKECVGDPSSIVLEKVWLQKIVSLMRIFQFRFFIVSFKDRETKRSLHLVGKMMKP